MSDREVEMQQKIDKLTGKINKMTNAISDFLKMAEEAIILTDNWQASIYPYVIGDEKLIAKKNSDIKRINDGLKKAKHRYQSTI